MRVQEVILENGKRYILVDNEGIPMMKYLKYLEVTGKSNNTQKTYCVNEHEPYTNSLAMIKGYRELKTT
ncbi:hypothetical protein AAIE21_18280 [Paenibacillus sp. 102]|uniref:hypothetical protein n=1 Tax=Paenibacillus sp. 102 TaxID=3120823 RepID=UPI0031BB05E5